jgi:hypothetical protein
MHEMSIDLSLAMNYLPACVCIVKSTVLIVALFIVHKYTLPALYITVGVCLVLDRMHCNMRIFDGNALLCGVLLGECVSLIRAGSRNDDYPSLVTLHVMGFIWICVAAAALAVPRGKQQHLSSKDLQLGSYLTSFAISVCAFLPADGSDTREVRIARSGGFVVLGVAWVYVVGVNMPRLIHGRESTTYLTVLFSPLLYVNCYLGVVHGVFAAVFLAWRLLGHVRGETEERRYAESPAVGGGENGAEDLQEMFRMAKAATHAEA